MDIEYNTYITEYILPCAINIPSEDDIVIDFATNVSTEVWFIDSFFLCELIICNFNSTLVIHTSFLGLFVFGRKVRCYGT